MTAPTASTPTQIPRLGLGTWHMGESRAQAAHEVTALRAAFDMGYRLIDTAEMYAYGGAESIVGEALRGALREAGMARGDFYVVSKVLPSNADAKGVVAACERSLARLGLDALDTYLLHWRGGVPFRETLRGFQTLLDRGLIRRWGVSNFDLDDLRELAALPGGQDCGSNQVWYSLGQRGPGFDLLPAMQHDGMTLMAYCPLDEAACHNTAACATSPRPAASHHPKSPSPGCSRNPASARSRSRRTPRACARTSRASSSRCRTAIGPNSTRCFHHRSEPRRWRWCSWPIDPHSRGWSRDVPRKR